MKLSGEAEGIWSISINKKIRMVYVLRGDTACFTNVGTHDQVYRK